MKEIERFQAIDENGHIYTIIGYADEQNALEGSYDWFTDYGDAVNQVSDGTYFIVGPDITVQRT